MQVKNPFFQLGQIVDFYGLPSFLPFYATHCHFAVKFSTPQFDPIFVCTNLTFTEFKTSKKTLFSSVRVNVTYKPIRHFLHIKKRFFSSTKKREKWNFYNGEKRMERKRRIFLRREKVNREWLETNKKSNKILFIFEREKHAK